MTDSDHPRPQIRSYRPADRAQLARICRLVGAAGGDATGLFTDDDLLAHVYLFPYLDLEPDAAWVIDTGGELGGYVVCAPNTREFVDRYRTEWLPLLADEGYSDPGAPPDGSWNLDHTAFNPEVMLIPEVDEYPAHLHISLSPSTQGQGLGRTLIRTLLADLASRGIERLHLSLDPENINAQRFYAHLGFTVLPSAEGGPTPIGIRTDAPI